MEGRVSKLLNIDYPCIKKKFGIKSQITLFKAKNRFSNHSCCGIDKLGKRIGFGKGMYDRFFLMNWVIDQ